HDVDAMEFGYAFGQIPGMPAAYDADENTIGAAVKVLNKNKPTHGVQGPVASGDSFIADSAQKSSIIGNFSNALAVDMESASIAQTCHQFNVPFIIIRSISDKADQAADITYEEFLKKACINSSEAVKSLLNELKCEGTLMTILMVLSIIITVIIGYLVYRDTDTEDNDIIE